MNSEQLRIFKRLMRPQADGCWLWTGEGTHDGYGQVRFPGQKRRPTHVVSYEHFVGEIPEGMDLGHLCHDRAVEDGSCPGGMDCRHRRCCNPEHLEPQTRSQNTIAQNHANRGKTHCSRGHEYDQANTRTDPQGKRHCRACDRARKQQ